MRENLTLTFNEIYLDNRKGRVTYDGATICALNVLTDSLHVDVTFLSVASKSAILVRVLQQTLASGYKLASKRM